MRGRPEVDVRFPKLIRPGLPFQVVVELLSGSDTPIDFVRLDLLGTESVNNFTQNSPLIARRELVHEERILHGEGVLKEGPHRHEVSFEIPSSSPPSHSGMRVDIDYSLRLHVSIPWWPDLEETFDLNVAPQLRARPPQQPASKSGARGGADPFVDLSLDDTTFGPGDQVTGAYAIANLKRSSDVDVDLALFAVERINTPQFSTVVEQSVFVLPATPEPLQPGAERRFSFRIPKDVTPTFKTDWSSLSWAIVASLRGAAWSAVHCALPITIATFEGQHTAEKADADIGATRWRRAWAEVAPSHGFSLHSSRLACQGRRGEISISVRPYTRDGADPGLEAIFTYPSIELDLRLRNASFLVLANELEKELGGAYRATCREEAQGKAFLTQELQQALSKHAIVEMDDRRLFVADPGTGQEAAWLGTFLERISTLADALLRAIDSIPPPADLLSGLAAWRAFSRSTGGRFVPGRMAIWGMAFEGGTFDLTTLFSDRGTPRATEVALSLDPPPLPEVDLSDESTFRGLPPGTKEIVTALGKSDGVLSVNLIRPQSHDADRARDIADKPELVVEMAGPSFDPASLRNRMLEMLSLARRLTGDRTPGPYR